MRPVFSEFFNFPEDFNFLGLNAAKYFYDLSLERETDLFDKPVMKKGLYKHDFLRNPLLVFFALIKLIHLLTTSRNKVIFYGNPDRIIKENSDYFDLYNYNIIKDIGLNHTLILQDRRDMIKNKKFSPSFIIDDFTPILVMMETVLKITLKKPLRKFIDQVGRKMEILGFSEDECISKMLKFYSRCLFFKFFLRIIHPKSALVICHYSKHAFIAACKHLRITVIELMHGQILSNHQNYNNSKISPEFIAVFRNWSLPDYIAVYGNFWRDKLVDGGFFSERHIINIGYFLKTITNTSPTIDPNNKKIILIASDPFIQPYLLSYLKFLKTKLHHDKYRINIKLHPSEDGKIFSKVIDNQLIFLEMNNIYKLFAQTNVLIGGFSTVLFEGIIYNLRIYTLFTPKYRKICEEIVETGIAEKLEMKQLPNFESIKEIRKCNIFDKYNFNDIGRLLF